MYPWDKLCWKEMKFHNDLFESDAINVGEALEVAGDECGEHCIDNQ